MVRQFLLCLRHDFSRELFPDQQQHENTAGLLHVRSCFSDDRSTASYWIEELAEPVCRRWRWILPKPQHRLLLQAAYHAVLPAQRSETLVHDVSVIVVAISYTHCGLRLFDPTAEISRKYLRIWPGTKFKELLFTVECRALERGLRGALWHCVYLPLYTIFVNIRAFYDVLESMLLEIMWLTFAMAWGTIKVWETRAAAAITYNGEHFTYNRDVFLENSWSFGQTLPLVLLLLPILSMAQAYLDNDAKAQEVRDQVEKNEGISEEKDASLTSGNVELNYVNTQDHVGEDLPDPQDPTLCSLRRCVHHPPLRLGHTRSSASSDNDSSTTTLQPGSLDASQPALVPPTASNLSASHLPRYPYARFTAHPWYLDHIFLLLCQLLMVTIVALWILTRIANIFGISAILRNRLFLIWVLAMVPVAAFVHLGVWYIASLIVTHLPGIEAWLKGQGMVTHNDDEWWWRRITMGQVVYWILRLGLVGGCLMLTFFGSLELAGPAALDDSF